MQPDDSIRELAKKTAKSIVDHGSIPMATLKESIILQEKVDELLAKEIEFPKAPEIQKVSLEGISVITIKGDKGDTGEKGDTGPQGIKGKDGRDGKDGKDGKDGRDGVDGVDGIDGIDGKDGKDGENGSSDTPEEIVSKIESLKDESRLDIKAIKGIDKILQSFRESLVQSRGVRALANLFDVSISGPTDGQVLTYNSARQTWINSDPTGGSGGGSGAIIFETPTGSIDGVNKTFTVVNTPVFIVSDGVTYFEGQGYTRVGLTLTLDNAPVGFLQSAYASSGSVETPSGTVNGINTTFTVVNTPTVIVSDGASYFNGAGFSLSGLTVTMDIPPTGYIRSLYGNFIATPNYAEETPAGLINSSNVSYTITTATKANTLLLFLNGQLQIRGTDYTISGTTITFSSPPETGSTLLANYQY